MSEQTSQNEKPMALPQFLLNLVIRPYKAFAQIDATGKPSWIWPVAATFIVIWLAAILTMPVVQKDAVAEFDQMLEQMGDTLPEQQLASMEAAREFSTSPAYLIAATGIAETIGVPILWGSAAGVLYLLSLAFGGQARFPTILRVTLWASVADILRRIIALIGTLVTGSLRAPGLSSLINSSEIVRSPGLAALAEVLAKISIYDIWFLILIAVGIIVCAKITRVKGGLVTAIFWLVSLIPPVAMAIIGAVASASYFG